jgi:hypothetical protein
MLVQSVSGSRCPKEGKPREYITDQTPEDVPDSAYYLRLVADGSLVLLEAKASDRINPVSTEVPVGSQEITKKKGGNK